jgi:hypothetical protein
MTNGTVGRQSALPMAGLPASVILEDRHYLGRSHRAKLTWEDDHGVMVFAAPSSRNLPKDWLELVRWCVVGEVVQAQQGDVIESRHLAGHGDRENHGSRQWKAAKRWLMTQSAATTVVSYSDPSVGHTGALYRACGWLWAPTWHRLFPPPTGQGQWTTNGKSEAVKDRWVALLRPDESRTNALAVRDGRIKRIAWAEYREPRWKRGIPQLTTGGGDYKKWKAEVR